MNLTETFAQKSYLHVELFVLMENEENPFIFKL